MGMLLFEAWVRREDFNFSLGSVRPEVWKVFSWTKRMVDGLTLSDSYSSREARSRVGGVEKLNWLLDELM